MSTARRLPPNDASRRGWCPSLARPMPTGDGLLARVHPPLGILTAAQLRAVAEAARLYGNGHIDITARGNLQIRGVSEGTACALAAHLTEAGLGDVRSDGGPQRLTLTSPLAGHDPDALIDAIALARAVEAMGLTIAGLSAKMLVAVESGGRWGLGEAEADLLIRPIAPSCVAIGLASETAHHWCPEVDVANAPQAIGRVLVAFVASEHRRMRDLDDTRRSSIAAIASGHVDGRADRQAPFPPPCGEGQRVGVVPLAAIGTSGTTPSSNSSPQGGGEPRSAMPPGFVRLGADLAAIVAEAPFGRCTADGLDAAAAIAGDKGVRCTPERGLVLLASPPRAEAILRSLNAAGFITDPADPRRAIAACPGAPACASGSTPVPEHAAHLAEAFAPFAARGLTAHVSGCAKGCAHPRPADLTLVAEDGLYRVVIDGAPGETGQPPSLTFEAALDRVRRADPARSLAGAFSS
ncbi:precorrin-3B synthase [Methylobacterium brachythecii]|uniref:Precorrin-3B synthase n=2 Tax=Methylobacterium brachythecii TaxID=1176177 RepID=A0ABQ6DE05_9HYPH|nr:precorrin-3B synthase [Methylobacterium brachythecii]GLS46765.1 precorrin-3B synthase [Methylobacterium brachythecii]